MFQSPKDPSGPTGHLPLAGEELSFAMGGMFLRALGHLPSFAMDGAFLRALGRLPSFAMDGVFLCALGHFPSFAMDGVFLRALGHSPSFAMAGFAQEHPLIVHSHFRGTIQSVIVENFKRSANVIEGCLEA